MWRKEGRDNGICNHSKGNKHPKDQEDLTKKSPRKIWRLWWKSEKDEYHWQWISLGDVSTLMNDVDTNKNISWWRAT